MSGLFAKWQPVYAEHGIATFPLKDDKRPAVRAWNKIGLPASRVFASKFGTSNGLGFVTSARNGVAVLDIDTTDENVLADALSRHGETPMVIRTASGKAHAYYRFNGERRRIRPWTGQPIDVLGAGGLVVAPPTLISKGDYQFISGSLDDIGRLPIMRGLDASMYLDSANLNHIKAPSIVPDDFRPGNPEPDQIPEGTRNNTLWRFCMTHAARYRNANRGAVIDRGALIEAARRWNADCLAPLPDAEVIELASSAWGYEARGSNWFGAGRRVIVSHNEVDELSQDAYYLLTILRRHHWARQFVVANAMAESLAWSRKRLAGARSELERKGKIKMLRTANQWQGAALYGWSL